MSEGAPLFTEGERRFLCGERNNEPYDRGVTKINLSVVAPPKLQ